MKIRLDVPSWDDPIVKAKLAQLAPHFSSGQAWHIISNCTSVISSIISIMSELVVLVGMLRGEEGGALFAALAAVGPIIDVLGNSSYGPQGMLLISSTLTTLLALYTLVFYVYLSNMLMRRMEKLDRLASQDEYRKHVVADGLQDYIQDGKLPV